MSKICENCGNMIPDGADVCPGCGRQQYSEEAIESILHDLSFALDELQKAENGDAAEDQEIELPGLNADLNLNLDTEEEELEEIPPFEVPGTEKKTVDPAIAAIETQSQKNMGRKAPARDTTGEKKSAPKGNTGKKAKKKKKKSGGGSSALAIIVGILIALLLVAGVVFFALYRMGFFDLVDGTSLLGEATSQTETLSTIETSQEPVAPQETEPVVEESVVEEPVEEEPEVETETEPETLIPEIETEEEEEPVVEVDKFNLTGSDDLTFTSRGETAQIVYVISPERAESEIEWVSSDETIATVNASGVITARRGGDCTVTGTCGDKEVTVQVRCSFSVPTTVLDMNYSDITMDHEGQEVQLRIDYDLTDAQIAATYWESSDPDVVSVDENGLITALDNGTVVISASIGDYTASCIVRCVNVAGNAGVNPANSEYVINYEDVTLSRKGEYFQLSMKSILGSDLPEYTWKSSDSSIATVDSNGVVTAVGDGTCKITTTLGNDNFECIVRVHISG